MYSVIIKISLHFSMKLYVLFHIAILSGGLNFRDIQSFEEIMENLNQILFEVGLSVPVFMENCILVINTTVVQYSSSI